MNRCTACMSTLVHQATALLMQPECPNLPIFGVCSELPTVQAVRRSSADGVCAPAAAAL